MQAVLTANWICPYESLVKQKNNADSLRPLCLERQMSHRGKVFTSVIALCSIFWILVWAVLMAFWI